MVMLTVPQKIVVSVEIEHDLPENVCLKAS